MAAPTLETDGTTLRVTDGTFGAPVTANDIWDWDDGTGSSGGDGDVPIDAGGAEKVSAYLTEHVADGVYQWHKAVWFGNGSDSSYFRTTNEMWWFDVGIVFDVRDSATFQGGILSSGHGIDGSTLSLEPTAPWALMDGETLATVLLYDTKLHNRSTYDAVFRSGTVTLNKAVLHGTSPGNFLFYQSLASLALTDVYSHGSSYGFSVQKAPDVFVGCHSHGCSYPAFNQSEAEVIIDSLKYSGESFLCSSYKAGSVVTLVDSVGAAKAPLVIVAGEVKKRFTVNIHVNDEDGADLEAATVTATSYGNIVSPTGATPFYRCIVDHTAGVWATDLATGKWEITSDDNAEVAGVTGAAGFGEWITGIDYVKAAEVFSVSTDADGDIAEQTITFQEWSTTSEAMQSYAPYTFVFSKTDYETLTMENIVPSAAIVWTQELQAEVQTRYDVACTQTKLQMDALPVSVGRTALTTIAE